MTARVLRNQELIRNCVNFFLLYDEILIAHIHQGARVFGYKRQIANDFGRFLGTSEAADQESASIGGRLST